MRKHLVTNLQTMSNFQEFMKTWTCDACVELIAKYLSLLLRLREHYFYLMNFLKTSPRNFRTSSWFMKTDFYIFFRLGFCPLIFVFLTLNELVVSDGASCKSLEVSTGDFLNKNIFCFHYQKFLWTIPDDRIYFSFLLFRSTW